MGDIPDGEKTRSSFLRIKLVPSQLGITRKNVARSSAVKNNARGDKRS